MENKINLHEGHRARMLEKILLNTELLAEHELVEILLTFAIPRKDVNPLAHQLIRTFGGIKGLFRADKNELLAVDGVGKKTAGLIIAVGEIIKIAEKTKKVDCKMQSPEQLGEYFKNKYKSLTEERFELILLNERYSIVNSVSYSDKNALSVFANPNELINLFAVHKPKFVTIAHNHIYGSAEPSKQDILSTKRLALLCSLHGVQLLDHVIVDRENIYSFRSNGILDQILKDIDIDNLLSGNFGGKLYE